VGRARRERKRQIHKFVSGGKRSENLLKRPDVR
jgi:hypothetical protein